MAKRVFVFITLFLCGSLYGQTLEQKLEQCAMVLDGSFSREALNNRRLLRSVMRAAGFSTISSEWWHFNMVSRDVARKNYRLIE